MPTFSITYSTADGQRFAAALGKAQGLMDTQTPPQPRSATAAECKAFLIAQIKSVINNVEGKTLQEAAMAAVVVPPSDFA